MKKKDKSKVLYVYEVVTKCKKFNDGQKILRTYEKMHDARTKDKSREISCAAHIPPCSIVLKLVEVRA